MSAKRFTPTILGIVFVMTATMISTNASAETDSTTTPIATPVVAGCSTTVSGASSTTIDETYINLCDVVLTRKDEGFDDVVTINGATFKCTSSLDGTATDFNRGYFENRMDEINSQVSAWRNTNPRTTWVPVNPPKQSCNFPSVSKEDNATTSFPVTSTKFGAGLFTTTCTTEFKMDTTFVYTMTIPTSNPEGNSMVLPQTKAWPWTVGFGGTRNCTWKLTLGTTGELSGTIAQNFGNLPKTQIDVEWNCKDEFTKVICVSYVITSEITVTDGTNIFYGASGSGIQTDVRILPALLIDMPFEANSNVSAASAGARYKRPVLKFASAIAKPSSSLSLRFKPNASPTKSTTSSTNKKLSFTVSKARKATCSITGKSGSRNITLVKTVKSSSKGLISTSLTSATLRTKLKLSVGKKASLTIICGTGKKKVVQRVSQVLK